MTVILKQEKSFQTVDIDEERILMLNAWDNHQDRHPGTMPEVDRVQRILETSMASSTSCQRTKPTSTTLLK